VAILEINNIVKRFGSVTAVQGVDLSVEEGEFIVLLGPSGCGKTTILRLVAGFIPLDDSGTISVMGKEVSSPSQTVPPNLRSMSMVFQGYAVWPHMTVFENVAYGLKLKKMAKAERQERVMEILSMVKMKDYANRYSHELSGGQQQRVALARALVVHPTILLLDEPLSNLDAKLRLEMRAEIKELHRRFKYTSIYVTHDQAEAMALADRIVLLKDGKIQQQGSPLELYQFPKCEFSAQFFGTTNLIPGIVTGIDAGGHSLRIDTPVGAELRIGRMDQLLREDTAKGDAVSISVRSGSMNVSREMPTGAVNTFEVTIEKVVFLGDVFDYEVRVNDTVLRAQGDPNERFEPGQKAYASFGEEASGVWCFKSG